MRQLLLAIAAGALLATTGVAADSRSDLYRALDLERAEGDYERALSLYIRAAGSGDVAVRSEALLGQARCLGRLDRKDEARKVLAALIESGAPKTFRDRARAELAKIPEEPKEPAVPPPPPDPEDEARKEREREETLRRELAAWFVSQAKAFYKEARPDDARERLAQALALDPANEEARALFARLGDTPGGRERLVQEILRLLEYEREVRLAELQSRADARIAAGEESLRAGELDETVARLEGCLRLIDANPEFARELAVRRARAEELIAGAVTRGGRRPERPAEPAPEAPDAWRESLRRLLVEMATSAPGAPQLRIHDVVLPPMPPRNEPVGADAFGWRGTPGDPVALLARLLPEAVPSGSWSDGTAFVRRLGDSLVVSGPPALQDAVAEQLARIGARQDRPIRLRVLAIGLSPEDLSLVHGAMEFTWSGTAPSAVIENPEQADRVVERFLSPEIGDVLAERELTLLSGGSVVLERMRSLNLLSPDSADGTGLDKVSFGLRLTILAVRTREGAIRLAVEPRTTSVDNLLDLPIRGRTFQVPELPAGRGECLLSLPSGGAGLVAGLGNPFVRKGESERSTMLLVFRSAGPAADEGPDRPAPPAEKGPVPVDLRGLDARPADDPSPAYRGEGPRPTESREGFLLRHLWSVLGEGGTDGAITLSHGAVWVDGDEEAVRRARAVVDALAATQSKLVKIRVRAAVVPLAAETDLTAGLEAGGKVEEGEGIRVFVLSGEDLRRVGYAVAGADGRYPLLREYLLARPTQLVHTLRATRFNYLSGFFAPPKSPARTGFPVYDHVEEGLAVEVRPLLGDGGRVELGLRVRVARVVDRRAGEEEEVRPVRPVLTVSEARVSGAVTAESALLVSGLAAPTPVRDRRERLVLLVEAAETSMPE